MMKHSDSQEQHSTEQPTGHWRLGPHGHLRSGAQPASIKTMKKKHAKKSIIIAVASIVVAILLVVSVLFLTQTGNEPPEGPNGETAKENVSQEQAGQNNDSVNSNLSEQDTLDTNGESDSESEESSNAPLDESNQSQNKTPRGNRVNVNQLPDSSFLYDTDIAELVAADSFNDGQIVQIKGEVVGDAINDEQDSSASWITIQDDDELNPSTISVRVDKSKLSLIDTFGRYKTTGSIVQARGEYHLACADHEGLSDIHVDELQLLEEGKAKEEPINPVVITAAFISVFLGVALLILYSIRRERMR